MDSQISQDLGTPTRSPNYSIQVMEKTLPVTVNAQTSPKERESHLKYRCTDSFFYWVRKRTGKKLFELSQRLQLFIC